MQEIKVIKDFEYWHRGYERADYKVGDVVSVDDEEMIEVAIDQGWISKPSDKPKAKK